jgi:arsenite methyltransferase
MSHETVPLDPERLVQEVRDRYAKIAAGRSDGCCSGSCGSGYEAESLAGAPADSNLGLGCGAPLDHLDPRAGETVLDLGSGGGLDVFLAARRVGPTGRAIGIDMTPEMLARARSAAAREGYDNVEFREGRLEALPVDDASVDAVTSNCVINLVPDKAAVFREIARVLRPGGRLVVADIVLDRPLPESVARSLLAWVGCVAGAIDRAAYLEMLDRTGLRDVEILRDVDYLAAIGDDLPDELVGALRNEGKSRLDLAGSVRSLTYRAWR